MGWFVIVLMWYSYCVEIMSKKTHAFLFALPECDKAFMRGSRWFIRLSLRVEGCHLCGWGLLTVPCREASSPSRRTCLLPTGKECCGIEQLTQIHYRPPSCGSLLGQLFVSIVVAPVSLSTMWVFSPDFVPYFNVSFLRIFLKKHQSFLLHHWYPWFHLLVVTAMDFKVRVEY